MFIEVTSHKTDKVHAINVNKIMYHLACLKLMSQDSYLFSETLVVPVKETLTVNESFDEVKRLIQGSRKESR